MNRTDVTSPVGQNTRMKCNRMVGAQTGSEERVRFLTARRFNYKYQDDGQERLEIIIATVRVFVAAGVRRPVTDSDCRPASVIHDDVYVFVCGYGAEKLVNTRENYTKNVPETYLFQRSRWSLRMVEQSFISKAWSVIRFDPYDFQRTIRTVIDRDFTALDCYRVNPPSPLFTSRVFLAHMRNFTRLTKTLTLGTVKIARSKKKKENPLWGCTFASLFEYDKIQ